MIKTFAQRLALPLLLLGLSAELAQAQQSAARIWNEEMLGAIRRNVPNPPAHARNLHHTAVAMYNSWAAYDSTAVGYLYNEKISSLPPDIEAARHEAVSYAAYRVLRSRFASGSGAAASLASFDAKLTQLGYSVSVAQSAVTNGTTPAELGKRVGQMILNWGAQDGFNQMDYPQAYTSAVNPNMDYPLSALGTNIWFQSNMPLGFGIPANTDPNFWQPLSLSNSVTQNGIPIPGGIQGFIGVQSLATIPFSLTRSDPTKPWLDPYGGPSRLSRPNAPSSTDAAYKDNFMDVLRKGAVLNDNTLINISPGAIGNNPLGTDNGTGRATNPVTGQPYPVNQVTRGDFTRVLAEYWADGPHSETPPGHWHLITNEVADDVDTVKRIGGVGPIVNNLEWDIKNYLAVSAATHDAACAAWALKRYYSGVRPITAIRHMCSKGQSSDPNGESYHPEGIPLETGVVELITDASVGTESSPGKHYQIWDVATNSYQDGSNFTGQIAVYSWPGENPSNAPAPSIATNQSTVRWMLGKDWLPFQRKTFNTPAFPGYVSGHSTFSRAAAEALTRITGSANFPGGFHNRIFPANSMQIDLGPSTNVELQWTTYYDAADQAGQSRRYGGIHPYEDDYHGRIIGSQAGISAYTKAEKFWTGNIQTESIQPSVAIQSNGNAVISWPQTLGRIYRIQRSSNFTNWVNVGKSQFSFGTTGSYTEVTPPVGSTYRIIETIPSAARLWNEQLLGAIRRNVPNPPAHARNIFHTSTAMYNAWAAYDSTAVGYLQNEKISPLPSNVEAARAEAISYAAYRVLRSRFATGAGAATSLAAFDAQLTAQGYSVSTAQSLGTNLTTPAELGKRIADAVLSWGTGDGFTNTTYPQPYNTAENPNMDPALSLGVLGNNGEFPSRANMPLGVGIPAGTNPNFWQPLALSVSVTQNGIPTPGGIQGFVGVQSLATVPFSLSRTDPTKPWLDPFGGPSKLSLPNAPSPTDAAYKAGVLGILQASAQLNDSTLIDISPSGVGNNPLGTDNGTGHPINPATGQPYPANMVTIGNYTRVLAEYWADGPNSETPPGHWQVIANEVADDPDTVKRIGGVGPIVNNLEWDIKAYFSLSAATHDAACAAWALKRYYSGPRPITMVRYMASLGQSTIQGVPSYHAQGLPLQTDVCEIITANTIQNGGKHESVWNVYTSSYEPGAWHIDEIAIKSWPGEHVDNLPAPSIATNQSTVRWMLAKDWLPFQRKTFNTPAFPGYTSGHSTFSRAAAEALTKLTGSPDFPGGFHNYVFAANSMQIDLGPSVPVDLQWRTYYDAADQAGQSRRFGGIHVSEDDYHGRITGSQAGISAYNLAAKYWTGTILAEKVVPSMTMQPTSVTMSTPTQRGLYYHLERSSNLTNWTPVTTSTRATNTTMSFTDPTPFSVTTPRFYRIVWGASAP